MPSEMIQESIDAIINYNIRHNWTDFLERCKFSGIGLRINQVYKEDSTTYTGHECEDRSLNYSVDDKNKTFLYAILDGHDGANASNFAAQKLPEELIFGQLEGKVSENDVKEAFTQYFFSIEKTFLEAIDPKIAERVQLLEKIPSTTMHYHAMHQYPDTFNRLQELEKELKSGTTCSVALVHNSVLYVGNVGDTRILLCQKDKNGVLKVKQLSADHTTNSHEELERLSRLSLNADQIRGKMLGSHKLTRCIGNYFLKGGYKEHELLSGASTEPLIPEPYIMSMPLDESCSFLILMSHGLFKSYEECTNSKQVNKEIAGMVIEQLLEQSSLTNVAQTVVDKIASMHLQAFLSKKTSVNMREDCTLVIRKFNFKLPVPSHAPTDAANVQKPLAMSAISSEEVTVCEELSIIDDPIAEDARKGGLPTPDRRSNAEPRHFFASAADSNRTPGIQGSLSVTSTSTESSMLSNPSLLKLVVDEKGFIRPYVDFEPYYRALDNCLADGTLQESQLHLYK